MRPLDPTKKTINKAVALTNSDYEIAQRIAGGNFSKAMRIALRFYAANNQLPELIQETFEENKHD